jgi:hypothetical protein
MMSPELPQSSLSKFGVGTGPVCAENLIRVGFERESSAIEATIALMCFCLRLFTLPSSRKSGLRQRTRRPDGRSLRVDLVSYETRELHLAPRQTPSVLRLTPRSFATFVEDIGNHCGFTGLAQYVRKLLIRLRGIRLVFLEPMCVCSATIWVFPP